jgi:hypothetical protein
MLDARFGDTLARPERPEIEIIVKCLDADRREYDDTESDGKSFLDNPCDIEEYDDRDQEYHEPDTSRLRVASFFCSGFEIFSSFLEIGHMRDINK